MKNMHPTSAVARSGASLSRLGALGLLGLLAGCGNIPQAKVSYYFATSTVSVQVVRSVLCDLGNFPVVATTVVPTVSHRADPSKDKPHELDLGWFRCSFSDADVKVELHEDGRLKSVNASSTGQGEAALKAASTLDLQLFGALTRSVSQANEPKKTALAPASDGAMVVDTLGRRMHARWDKSAQALPH